MQYYVPSIAEIYMTSFNKFFLAVDKLNEKNVKIAKTKKHKAIGH